MNRREIIDDNLGQLLDDRLLSFIPSRSLNEQTVDVNSIGWWPADSKILMDKKNRFYHKKENSLFSSHRFQYFKVERQRVDWNFEFPGIVLHHTGEKCLREEEPRQPEIARLPLFIPLL